MSNQNNSYGANRRKVETPHRSPVIAGVLSAILPGAGQIYTGQIARGIGFMLLAASMVGLLLWARTTHEFEIFQGILIVMLVALVLFWLWQIVSAVWGATNRKFASSWGLILVLIFTYFLGWQATEVNLRKFFTEFSDTFTIFTRVMWPWEAAIERPEELTTIKSPWGNPCPEILSEAPEQTGSESSGVWVMVDPPCGELGSYVVGEGLKEGTMLTVRGGGFDPNDTVEIWWEDPIGQEFQPRYQGDTVSTTTDSQGNFEIAFSAPQYQTPATAVGMQVHKVEARQVKSVGAPILSETVSLAFGRMLITIFQALMATTFGIVLALPFSFLAARNLMSGNPFTLAIYYGIRFILNVTRSIEPIIWAVIATVWVGLGPFAGVIALTIHTIAALGKLYSEAIESIDPGPIEAITATGANWLQVIIYAIIPQVIPPFLSFTIYRWDINVRMSTIIGFVGGGGIGQILFQWINQTRWSSAGIAVWMIAFTVSVMDYASSELRKRFV